uniref:Uncharacterized protein n=1 Tax=Ditylenchus dipsaci TaxID=166011 RepID=A0A915DZ76_9BILA
MVFHVASAANVDVHLVNQNQLSAEDRLRHWLTTEASMLTVWEEKDACELVGNMKREIRRQYAQTKSDGSLVDPMKNLLHSIDTDDSKKEYENWVSSFPYLHVKEDSVDKENPDEHLI